MSKRAIIAGAGIGGLSAAIALSQAGFRVVIYEKTNTLEEFGAGLQVTPNATRILSRLGVLKWILPLASRPHAVLVLRGSDNVKLMRMPLDDAERRWGASYLSIHRADLQRALVAAARDHSDIEFALGTAVLDFADDGRRLSVGVAKGLTQRSEDADLLIGADGLRSQVRERLGFGVRDEAQFAGRVAYRAILDSDDADAEWTQNVILRLGKDAHLVQYPLRGGSMINVVATVRSALPITDAERQNDHSVNRQSLERAFAGWSKEARHLTNAPVQWRAWPLYHRPPISSFSVGRVALVGDAAHPMVPFLAQGAAQAIEDAGALARVLAQVLDIPDALSIYSRDRVARASRVQREALKLGRIYHMSGPSAFARDATMRLFGRRGLIERYDWLYGA